MRSLLGVMFVVGCVLALDGLVVLVHSSHQPGIAGVWPPTDAATKRHVVDALSILTALALSLLVTFIAFDERERQSDKAERARFTNMLAEIYERDKARDARGSEGDDDA
jgi:hypothetical protein